MYIELEPCVPDITFFATRRADVMRNYMVKIFPILATVLCLGVVGLASAQNCDKALDEYLGLLALTAYGSANLEDLADVDQLIKDAKKTSSSQGSCEALASAKNSETSRRILERHEEGEAALGTNSVEASNAEREIHWEEVSGYDAMTDLFQVDGYAATVASCKSKFPSHEQSRTKSLEEFKARIDYPALEKKVEHFMNSIGKSNEYAVMRMMAPAGEDTREWSIERCDVYAKNTPFDQLYGIRRQGE